MEVDEGSVNTAMLDGLGQERDEEAEEVVGLVLSEGCDEVVAGQREVGGLRSGKEGEVVVQAECTRERKHEG